MTTLRLVCCMSGQLMHSRVNSLHTPPSPSYSSSTEIFWAISQPCVWFTSNQKRLSTIWACCVTKSTDLRSYQKVNSMCYCDRVPVYGLMSQKLPHDSHCIRLSKCRDLGSACIVLLTWPRVAGILKVLMKAYLPHPNISETISC